MLIMTVSSCLKYDESIPYRRYYYYRNEPHSDDKLIAIESIDEAEGYIRRKRVYNSDYEIILSIDNFVRDRFLHGYSEYSFHRNWIAYLSGYLWRDLRNPVIPDEIMRHRIAGCSQQALVVQELLRRFRIEYQSVGFRDPNHFATAAKLGDQWILVDPDLYPINKQPIPIKSLFDGSTSNKIYDEPFASGVKWAASHNGIWLMHKNTNPAKEAFIFDKITQFSSKFAFLLFFSIYFLLKFSTRRSNRGSPY